MENKNITCPVFFKPAVIGHKSVYFSVPGTPVAKQRPRATRKGRFVQVYTPRETKMYEKKVEKCYKELYTRVDKLKGSLSAEIEGVFAPPISISNKKREEMLNNKVPHTKKPDCDNLGKTPLDGLNGIAYDDDSQITNLSVSKRFGKESKLNITIWENS